VAIPQPAIPSIYDQVLRHPITQRAEVLSRSGSTAAQGSSPLRNIEFWFRVHAVLFCANRFDVAARMLNRFPPRRELSAWGIDPVNWIERVARDHVVSVATMADLLLRLLEGIYNLGLDPRDIKISTFKKHTLLRTSPSLPAIEDFLDSVLECVNTRHRALHRGEENSAKVLLSRKERIDRGDRPAGPSSVWGEMGFRVLRYYVAIGEAWSLDEGRRVDLAAAKIELERMRTDVASALTIERGIIGSKLAVAMDKLEAECAVRPELTPVVRRASGRSRRAKS
jgi:hypothetical protein